MSSEITSDRDSRQPIIRRTTLSAHNEGSTRTEIDFGE